MIIEKIYVVISGIFFILMFSIWTTKTWINVFIKMFIAVLAIAATYIFVHSM